MDPLGSVGTEARCKCRDLLTRGPLWPTARAERLERGAMLGELGDEPSLGLTRAEMEDPDQHQRRNDD